jgi:hypothetical protein
MCGKNYKRFCYFNSLTFDVAIRAIPRIPKIILKDKGKIPKNIKAAPVNAKIIPTIN